MSFKLKTTHIIVFSVLICILACVTIILLANTGKKEFAMYKPYSDNNELIKCDLNLQIDQDAPKMEVASAFYPIAANIVQNIYTKDAYSDDKLKLVSTAEAYSDISNNKADIIIATEPSEEQEKMIKEANVELEYKTLYLEPLLIVANKEKIDKVETLDINTISDIYTGESDWNTYQLEKNNGSQTCFEKIVKDNPIEKNHYEIRTMNEIIDRIAEDNNGIGYTFSTYFFKMHYNENVKPLRVNNYNYTDDQYPLLNKVYIICRKDNKNSNIKKIMNWLETVEYKDFINKITK